MSECITCHTYHATPVVVSASHESAGTLEENAAQRDSLGKANVQRSTFNVNFLLNNDRTDSKLNVGR